MFREIVGGVECEVGDAALEDCNECAGLWGHSK